MKILAAFDKFKDSMTAATACEAAARGARAVYGTQVTVVQTPLTDGGEGFCNILTNAAKGHIETHVVCGPLGADLEAPLGWCEIETLPAAVQRSLNLNQGKIAIIEMAAAAGLEQVPAERRHPKNCTTYGVGELIRIAVAESADAILLGIGGSATSDLGLGALQALGLQFINSEGHLVEQALPRDWPHIQTIQGKLDVPTPPIFIACDVDNPLLGPRGAAAIYGPQKGLTANELDAFETQAAHMAEQLCQHFAQPSTCQEIPGSGAAGGIGFGLNLACGAHYLAGFDLVTDWLELNSKIAAADLILSGEGCIDRS
ncbi:MAG: glycerate kinase, partial [Planctomycetes bacterium]|nr:glycerate kinase [Planctomycetota bacterium]